MIFLLFSLIISIGIGIAVVTVVPVSGTNLNATIRCFVPDPNIDPGFLLNGTNGKIDPSFIRKDSSLINPCT